MKPTPVRILVLTAALAAGCGGAPKSAPPPSPATPCLRWLVSVDNEFAFPVAVHVYAAQRRVSLGAAPPGRTQHTSPDSGQISFTAPLGMSLAARGRQIRGVLQCAQRAPA